jgi:hypothetical protein
MSLIRSHCAVDKVSVPVVPGSSDRVRALMAGRQNGTVTWKEFKDQVQSLTMEELAELSRQIRKRTRV